MRRWCRNGHDRTVVGVRVFQDGRRIECAACRSAQTERRRTGPTTVPTVPGEPLRRYLGCATCRDGTEHVPGDRSGTHAAYVRRYAQRFGISERQAMRDLAPIRAGAPVSVFVADRVLTLAGSHLAIEYGKEVAA